MLVKLFSQSPPKMLKPVLMCFRKPATVTKHTGLNESDASAESENEGATSDNPSETNTGSTSKGMNYRHSYLRYC